MLQIQFKSVWLHVSTSTGRSASTKWQARDDYDPVSQLADELYRKSLVHAAMSMAYRKVGDPTGATDVDHVSGATCEDPKTDIVIGDNTIPDCFASYNTTATISDRVKYYTWWRFDPLHRLFQGLISCSDGSKPSLTSFVSGEIQYELTEASDMVRIMSYARIFFRQS